MNLDECFEKNLLRKGRPSRKKMERMERKGSLKSVLDTSETDNNERKKDK